MTQADDTGFHPELIADLDRALAPFKRLLSPVSFGLEHVPREGAVLLAGNHTIYGLIDIPMLGLEIYEQTGRVVRGLGDHNHFELPVWRELLTRIGAVRGTRDNCRRLFADGEAVLVFPGGGREVMKHKGEKYKLVWKERIGFASLAIEHGVPIVPFASVGVEDMFEILLDADEILHSPLGKLADALGISDQPWFRHGEIIPPLARGTGPAGLPRLQRQYFDFSAPIDTTRFAGLHQDRAACFALRGEVQTAIQAGIARLSEVRDADPERYPVQRALRRLASKLG
ncbi:MAG: lysophospholipid acyltransferase family protein [Myxococcota bacterium]|nr:lysophospholipid acyltransferase family protein [Myxococcota bacterium]